MVLCDRFQYRIFLGMEIINETHFRKSSEIPLEDYPTYADLGASNKKLKKSLEVLRVELGEFQDMLYAHGKYSVLICLQGMDTAGKDSLIREVFKDCNVRGVVVHSFKVPTELELKHDFLWRHYIALPAKGKFGVFNRTHYENVLVTKVHPSYILSEAIPGIHSVADIDTGFWEKRYRKINDFEKHLAESGTIIFKFFLHLSKEEQKKRLLRRLDLPAKNWKFSPGDLKERELWDAYQQCYEEALQHTSKPHAPWYVIPADNKKAARLIVADILLNTLKKYKDIAPPPLDDKIKANLDDYKRRLENE